MTDSSTGQIWLNGPSNPIAAATALAASSSGTSAATTAPKASRRMIRVTGSDVTSAWRKSFSIDSLTCLLALASPNSSIRNSGCASLRPVTVFSGASTRSSAVTSLSSPGSGISKLTSAERPSCEIAPWLPAK